jgi:hypothetical protein
MIQKNDKEIIYEQQNMQEQYHQIRHHSQQQKQQLSLSDISPIWASRLKEKQSPLFLLSFTRLLWLFEIIHPKKCVVAEAYGFSSSYTNNCNQCARIGNKFSFYYTMGYSKKIKENQLRFIIHWNEKHL